MEFTTSAQDHTFITVLYDRDLYFLQALVRDLSLRQT
jgi:hypothetical protein